MAVWAEVRRSQFEYGRLDAQFYRPEYLLLKQRLVKSGLPLNRLGSLSQKIDVGYVGPMVHAYADTGILLLRSQNISEFYIDEAKNQIRIKPAFHQALRKSEVFSGDILITRSGKAGNAAIVPDGFEPANSADIIIIRLLPEFSSLYTIAFLNSKYGRFQIDRQVSGGVQGHLNLTIAADILIPEPPGHFVARIDGEVEQALDSMRLAKAKYAAAAALFQQPLHLDALARSQEQSYETTISQAVESRRFDAQHFRPEYETLFGSMRKAVGKDNVRPLRELVTFNQRGEQPIYTDGPVAVVNSQHLGPQHVAFDEVEHTSQVIYDSDRRSRLSSGDVLVYATGAYVGRTNVFLEDDAAVASNHVNILRVRPEYDSAYIALVLNSQVGAMQTAKHSTGSTQAELYPVNLARFWIPLLPRPQQEAIGDKVRESYAALKQSKALLEQAKRRVEELIEREAAK
jgi:restriction endonuclease S subunit